MATRTRPADPSAPTELIGPPPEPPPDRELWPWLLVLLILVVAALAAVWYATRDAGGVSAQPVTVPTTAAATPKPEPVHKTTTAPTTTAPPQTVVVPDLVGQTRDDAIGTLEAQGLTPDVRDVPSAEADGTVVSQHPAGGTTVQAQAGVLLNVGHKVAPQPKPAKAEPQPRPAKAEPQHSRAAALAAIPAVVGEDKDSAKAALRNAGFHAHMEKQDTADPSQDGLVVEQSPTGGAAAEAGSDVTIVVGRYRDDGEDATG